ncbi:MAG: hypothetical protein HRU19_30005 [Pseudobacteriovorax sp.]|nr:hypothetical protein [Pseudobacteriovorax sp.]
MTAKIANRILGQPHTLLCRFPSGLSTYGQKELKTIITSFESPGKYPCQLTQGPNQTCLVENIDFRQALELVARTATARHIYIEIASRHVGSFAELNELFSKIAWQHYLCKTQEYGVHVDSRQSKLYHEAKIRDALSKKLDASGYQQNSTERAIDIFVDQEKNRCRVFLSFSGSHLYKRGFKTSYQTKAPLNENIAAALCRELPLEPVDIIYNPFAGSGTFATEQAMIISQVAPLLLRNESFSFEAQDWFPTKSLSFITRKLGTHLKASPKIICVEKDQKQSAELEENLDAFDAKLSLDLDFEVKTADAFLETFDGLLGKNLRLLINPPYGIRLSKSRQNDLFIERLAEYIEAIAKVCGKMDGICLFPKAVGADRLRSLLGNYVSKTIGINQGGQHVIAIYLDKQ